MPQDYASYGNKKTTTCAISTYMDIASEARGEAIISKNNVRWGIYLSLIVESSSSINMFGRSKTGQFLHNLEILIHRILKMFHSLLNFLS